jgi:hypothetical protein
MAGIALNVTDSANDLVDGVGVTLIRFRDLTARTFGVRGTYSPLTVIL